MKFGAVIVTYNRIGELRRSLKCYTHQTRPIDRLIVVDNCSTDGTVEYLQLWEKRDEGVTKEVVYLPSNMGGSGGFHHGLKKMLTYEDIDWIWVADDDAYPVLDAFEKAETFINDHADEMDTIAAICGGCGYDGHFSNIQRFRLKKSFFGLQDMPIPQEWFSNKDGFAENLTFPTGIAVTVSPSKSAPESLAAVLALIPIAFLASVPINFLPSRLLLLTVNRGTSNGPECGYLIRTISSPFLKLGA